MSEDDKKENKKKFFSDRFKPTLTCACGNPVKLEQDFSDKYTQFIWKGKCDKCTEKYGVELIDGTRR